MVLEEPRHLFLCKLSVLPPCLSLWWQPEQLSRNSICSPVLLPSTAHQHFRVERWSLSPWAWGVGARFVPWWNWPQALTPRTTQQVKLQQIPRPLEGESAIFISHPLYVFQSHATCIVINLINLYSMNQLYWFLQSFSNKGSQSLYISFYYFF